MDKVNLYRTLGVAKDAAKQEIKRAFRRRATETHPDKGGKAEEFHRVSTAYAVLTDDRRRAEYDETGEYQQSGNNISTSTSTSTTWQTVFDVFANSR